MAPVWCLGRTSQWIETSDPPSPSGTRRKKSERKKAEKRKKGTIYRAPARVRRRKEMARAEALRRAELQIVDAWASCIPLRVSLTLESLLAI